jgi:hypothetical protein
MAMHWKVDPALLILVWRAASVPPTALWRDQATLLCLYWLLTVFKAPSRVWRMGTVAVMGLLLFVFLREQLLLSLAVLGLGR